MFTYFMSKTYQMFLIGCSVDKFAFIFVLYFIGRFFQIPWVCMAFRTTWRQFMISRYGAVFYKCIWKSSNNPFGASKYSPRSADQFLQHAFLRWHLILKDPFVLNNIWDFLSWCVISKGLFHLSLTFSIFLAHPHSKREKKRLATSISFIYLKYLLKFFLEID